MAPRAAYRQVSAKAKEAGINCVIFRLFCSLTTALGDSGVYDSSLYCNNLPLPHFKTQMDDGSTRTTVLELVTTCRRVMNIISGFNGVNDTIKLFSNDIQELSNELKCFGEDLSMTREEWKGGHWVNAPMDDCQSSLARLEQILEDSKKVDGVSSTWRTIDFDSREVSLLHREFTAYRWMIQLSRLLIVYVS